MPIQPLEVYNVEETGELVLKHRDLKEALISPNVIMIVNHNDKEIVLWIGKGASTRAKFAGARSSRRFLTERSLSYRVKSCDEEDEPEWFQKLFEIKVAKRSRDEPPSLEVLAILNEMKAEIIPEGFEREACIISRDFYVPVEYKSSIMGKDTTAMKFEKSSYLPEGFFDLPSEAYQPRLLVRSGKILGIDLLINLNVIKEIKPKSSLKHTGEAISPTIQKLKKEGAKKDEQINDLKSQLSQINKKLDKKDLEIQKLKQITLSVDQQIEQIQLEDLQQDISQKDELIENLQQKVERAKSQIDKLEMEKERKEQEIEKLQENLFNENQQLESLQQEVQKNKSQIDTLEREKVKKEHQIEELKQNISKKDQELQEKICIIEDMDNKIREQSRKIQELESK